MFLVFLLFHAFNTGDNMKLDSITEGMVDIEFCRYVGPREDPKLSFHIENSDEGDNVVVEISADERFSGIVFLRIDDLERMHCLYVNGGHKRYEIKNMTRGNYLATLSFYGNHMFRPDEISTKFKVYKERIDSNLSLEINDGAAEGIAIVESGADELFNDFVDLKIGDSDVAHSIHIKDGYRRFSIRNWVRGKRRARLSYGGNSLFKPKSIYKG